MTPQPESRVLKIENLETEIDIERSKVEALRAIAEQLRSIDEKLHLLVYPGDK